MTNAWSNVSFLKEVDESTFNKPVAGSSLTEGLHTDVTLAGIEPKEYDDKPAISIIWEKDGETRKDTIFLMNYEGDGLSRSYLALSQALSVDTASRFEFFARKVFENQNLLEDLVGFKANIKVGFKKVKEPDVKFKIVNLGDDGYKIVAAFDNESAPSDLPDNVFDDYESAKEAAEDNDLKLVYLNVLSHSVPSDKEALNEQTARLQDTVYGKGDAKATGTDSNIVI